MKTIKSVLAFALILASFFAKSQTSPPTLKGNDYSNGLFDSIAGVFSSGETKTYHLSEIDANAKKSDGGGGSVQSYTMMNCSDPNNYFDVYFETGSGFEGPTLIEMQRKAVLCQVLTDISNFITNKGGVTNRVRILIGALPIATFSTSLLLGKGGAFFITPQTNIPPLGGITDCAAWLTINTGQDAFYNLIGGYGGQYFHCNLYINFTNPGINWHTGLTSPPVGGQVDLYSTILHEVNHALGFQSLIDYQGLSRILVGPTYYNRYDKFLTTQSGIPLIVPTGTCAAFSYSWNIGSIPNPTVTLSPGSSPSLALCPSPPLVGNQTNITTCTTAIKFAGTNTVSVYTQDCFVRDGSLSHFEDMCPPIPPGNNDLYFNMSNSTSTIGSLSAKRFYQEEERSAMCDIGYAVGSSFGASGNFQHTKTYTASPCPGISVAGVNDGVLPNGLFAFTSNVLSASAPIFPLVNDLGSPTSFSCLQLIYGAGTFTYGPTSFSFTPASQGLHAFRYVPVSSTGEQGNITYICFFAMSTSCTSTCNIISNGGFENSTGCGSNQSIITYTNDCWTPGLGTPDFYKRFCSAVPGYTIPALSVNTWDFPAPTNNNFYGLANTDGYNESIQGQLSTTLNPLSTYVFQGWFYTAPWLTGSPVKPLTFDLTASTGPYAPGATNTSTYPSGVLTLTTLTVPTTGIWTYLSSTFTYTGSTPATFIQLRMPYVGNVPTGSTDGYIAMIDDLSLMTSSTAVTFTPPLNVCLGSNVVNLASYATPTTSGTYSISGPGVVFSGGIYTFSSSATGIGTYNVLYTYTNTTGCTYTAAAQFNVIQPLAGNMNVGSYPTWTICPNTTFTADVSVTGVSTPSLLANYSFTWMPSGSTGITFTDSPLSNTVYTVTGQDNFGCGAPVSLTFTVLAALPTITLSPVTQTICAGQNATITINAQLSGIVTWTPNPFIQTNTVAVDNPTVTTTYTAFASQATGTCSATATTTIFVVPIPTITVGPASQTICAGSSATITASGAGSYLVQPPGITFTTTPIVLSPSTTTNFMITGFSGACRSANVPTVDVVVVNCCSATASITTPSITVNTTLTPNSYALNNNLSVSAKLVVNSSELIIGSGVTITVQPTGKLVFDNVHAYACTNMWQGIVVQDGGEVTIRNNSLIEDAIIAVEVPNNTNTVPNILQIKNSTFNKNLTAISISNYTQAVNPYPFVIHSNVFTCRTLTFTSTSWPTVATLQESTTQTNPLVSPYLMQGSPTNLKNPFSTTTSTTGINLLTVGQIVNPLSSSPVYYEITIGDSTSKPNFNLFDHLGSGIFSANSSFRATNNVFQYLSPPVGFGAGGVGVRATNNNLGVSHVRLFGKVPTPNVFNKFYDCYIGVSLNNVLIADITKCDIRAAFPTNTVTPSLSYPGRSGIVITSNRFANYNFSSNTMHNISNGINFIANYQAMPSIFTYTFGMYAGYVNIQLNDMRSTLGPVTTQFINNGIAVQQPISAPPSASLQIVPSSSVNISLNSFKKAYRGIFIQFWRNGQFIRTDGNDITLNDDAITGATKQWGINTSACLNQEVMNNFIQSANKTNTMVSCFYSSMTNSLSVTCNTLTTSHKGFEFGGAHLNVIWMGNDMDNHKRGYQLTNSGVIGTQGNTLTPIDNKWNGTWTGTNYNTWVELSSATSSTLHVRSTAPYFPTNNNGNPPINSYSLTAGLTLASGTSFNCSSGGGSSTQRVMEQIAQDSLPFVANITESKFITKHALHRKLKSEPALMSSNSILQNFYTTDLTTPRAKLSGIEEYLGLGDFTSANAQMAVVSPTNSIEANYLNFYRIYWNYFNNSYSTYDSLTLINLCVKCPFIEGEVVYQARSLYNMIYEDILIFNDNCPSEEENSRLFQNSIDNSKLIAQNNWNIQLYPNPATNDLYITSSNNAENLKVRITDVTGKLCADYSITTEAFVGSIKLGLLDGIYLVTVVNSDNEQIIKKLIVSH